MARRLLALPQARVAVIMGSGLSMVPRGLTVERTYDYEELGWPGGGVQGHAGRLHVAGDVLLAHGRVHLYEGWAAPELERPVRDMARAGVQKVVSLCAVGGLDATLTVGSVLVAHTVVDAQDPPSVAEPQRLTVCTPAAAKQTAQLLATAVETRVGTYVAVAGPQYETPAEAAWLATWGDVVGMSTAPEVRAAVDLGLDCRVVAVVTNAAGASLGHDEVLHAGKTAARGLRDVLGRLL